MKIKNRHVSVFFYCRVVTQFICYHSYGAYDGATYAQRMMELTTAAQNERDED